MDRIDTVASAGNEKTYTALAKDIARKYGVSRQHVYNLVENSDIPHRKIGTAIRFNLEEVDEWMRSRTPEPTKAAV